MILLSIETSCDETAVSIVSYEKEFPLKFRVLSHRVLSQIDIHKEYGGVFPKLAKREHTRTLPILLAEALKEAGVLAEFPESKPLSEADTSYLDVLFAREPELKGSFSLFFENISPPAIDAIAVTQGPGLAPALWVGLNVASALRHVWHIPVYGINHMEGHIYASLIERSDSAEYTIDLPDFPSLGLLISGGHTEIIRILPPMNYEIIGYTLDDAVGEAFDKVARSLGLQYPGGPKISEYAHKARTEGLVVPEELRLPRPMLHSKDYNFSFSGIKTAVATRVLRIPEIDDHTRRVISFEFENAVTDVLVSKVKRAMFETGSRSLVVGGGVIANTHIRTALTLLAREEGFSIFIPDVVHSTDNGLMIAVAGIMRTIYDTPSADLSARPNWKISECTPTSSDTHIPQARKKSRNTK